MQDVDAALLIAVAILALDADMPFLHLEGPGGQLGEMRFGAGHVRAEHGLAARGQMAVNELQQRPVQVIKVQELRRDDAVEAFGEALVLAGAGNIQIADVDQVLQVVAQHVGTGELEGIVDDVAGHDMAESVTGGHQAEHTAAAAQLQHGLALGLQLAQEASQHEGPRPDLGPERQVLQRVMDGMPCQQAVQMALHIVDVQDLQLTVIQLQGDKVHVEGLADVRKDLVQHRRLPYILPAMTAQQEGRV